MVHRTSTLHPRQVNKELWVILSLFAVALLLNEQLVSPRMAMSFYALPTVLSAYLFGRRHATLTALASVLLVVLITLYSDWVPANMSLAALVSGRWMDVTVWGGSLVLTGYGMGTLYDDKTAQVQEHAHHDKFDGSGYNPTRGEDLPIEARIVAVADVYDSLTSDRPYRKGMLPAEARDIIMNGSSRRHELEIPVGSTAMAA